MQVTQGFIIALFDHDRYPEPQLSLAIRKHEPKIKTDHIIGPLARTQHLALPHTYDPYANWTSSMLANILSTSLSALLVKLLSLYIYI